MPRITPRTPEDSAVATAEPTQAKNYIAAPSGIVHTDELEVGQIPDRVMKSTGDARQSLERADIAMVSDSPMDAEWIANMAFMAEMIDIIVPDSDDPNAEQIFEININGRPFVFQRGETKTIPRYVADHMLRMKQTKYKQKEVVNKDGVKDIVHPSTTTLKYPLMIARDPNPNSRAWYQATMAMRG